MHSVTRYHDISTGHRVAGHESKCSNLHGHNYRIHFTCVPDTTRLSLRDQLRSGSVLDAIGRVIDFSVIKDKLCAWIEEHWDHKFLVWAEDPMRPKIYGAHAESVVIVPFNPTAENMAEYLVDVIGPALLEGTGAVLSSVTIEETRKCSATYSKKDVS